MPIGLSSCVPYNYVARPRFLNVLLLRFSLCISMSCTNSLIRRLVIFIYVSVLCRHLFAYLFDFRYRLRRIVFTLQNFVVCERGNLELAKCRNTVLKTVK